MFAYLAEDILPFPSQLFSAFGRNNSSILWEWYETQKMWVKCRFPFPRPSNTYYRCADKSLARPGSKQANVSVRMAWISFGALTCRKKKTWWHLASRCCWNRARPWHASELVSFLVGLRTYQHLGSAVSSETRQHFPLYQVQCRALIHAFLYGVLCWGFLNACQWMAAF